AINRLLIKAQTVVIVPHGADDLDARVASGAVQREQSTLAVAAHANGGVIFLSGKPIHGGEYLLHLVADDVAAHLVAHAINELAVWLMREALGASAARVGIVAIDEHGNQHAATAARQDPTHLIAARRGTTCHIRPVLGNLIRIGQSDDVRSYLLLGL